MNGQREYDSREGESLTPTKRQIRKLLRVDAPCSWLFAIGMISVLGWGAIVWASQAFGYAAPKIGRPIPAIVGLLSLLFVLHLCAIWLGIRSRAQSQVWWTTLTFAVIFRLLMVFSEPIQEQDFYRYLWDGQAVVAGVSPYRYSPDRVLQSASQDEDMPRDLQRLLAVRDSDPVINTILSRVHYANLPSIYPPVSQVIFAAATWTTSRSAPIRTRIIVLKMWIISFDLGVLLLVAGVLKHVGASVGWALAWGWSPLVVKEFANSGHLDAIAVFFSMLAVLTMLRGLFPRPSGVANPIAARYSRLWLFLSAASLALAIAAKLYPVVLAPLFGITVLKRCGSRATAESFAILAVLALALCWPMWSGRPRAAETAERQASNSASIDVSWQPSQRSLQVFLTSWKMNDFVTLILESNLDPGVRGAGYVAPWFAVVPRAWRQRIVDSVVSVAGTSPEHTPFLLARCITALIFAMLALWWIVQAARAPTPEAWLRCVFLTLAWFWVLSPTLNPWYWSWALPLVAFAHCRSWLLVSGFLMFYYTRFWFMYQWPDACVAGTPYVGSTYFDFVIVWLEHTPWMAALAIEAVFRRLRARSDSAATTGE